jgi:hypothetical protein
VFKMAEAFVLEIWKVECRVALDFALSWRYYRVPIFVYDHRLARDQYLSNVLYCRPNFVSS